MLPRFVHPLALTAALLGATQAFGQSPPQFPTRDIPATPERRAPRFEASIIVKPKPGLQTLTAPSGVPSFLSLDVTSSIGLEPQPKATASGELIYRVKPEVVLQGATPDATRERLMSIVSQLRQRSDVEYVQLNWIAEPHATPNDPHFKYMWSYHDRTTQNPGGISLPKMWGRGQGKREIVVAIIDTGILPSEEDTIGSLNLATGTDMISEPARAKDGDGRDNDPTDLGDASAAGECGQGSLASPDSWHGTHVAGTIGASITNNAKGIAGINWEVTVVPVRVLGKCGGTFEDIHDAMRWAAGLPVKDVAPNPKPARIINMSLGAHWLSCSDSPATQATIDAVVAAGVLVIVSAGNAANDASLNTPAGCNNVLTVAASDARGHLATRYSSYGNSVGILAPGGDVQRDDNNDGIKDGILSIVKGQYSLYNGTSMAAPHVAGVAALLLAQRPDLTPAEVIDILKRNAIPRDATQCPQPCGAGLLNADIVLPPGPGPATTSGASPSAKR
jgi:serine protease